MTVIIDLELLKALGKQTESTAKAAESPGFSMYWRSLGRDPAQAVADLFTSGLADRLAAVAAEGADGRSTLNALGRISGVSIAQQVKRHLPSGTMGEIKVEFIPGGDLPVYAQGNVLAVNVFALSLRGNKLYIGDYPFLSFLANRVHRLCTAGLGVRSPADNTDSLTTFLSGLLREGCATLFFTVPYSGPVFQQWQQAEGQREAQVKSLRRLILTPEPSPALVAELAQNFALTGEAALAARYPLGTWLCQVIEGAFSRSFLVELLLRAHFFCRAYEEARVKFGLPDKYSLAPAK